MQVAQDNLRLNGIAFDAVNPENDIHPVVNKAEATVTVDFSLPFRPALMEALLGQHIALEPPVVSAAAIRPLAIVIVADCSLSMLCRASGDPSPCYGDTGWTFAGSRLQAVMTAGQSFLNSLDEQHDAIAIVGFSDVAVTQRQMTTPFDKDQIKADLMMLSFGVRTNIRAGIVNAHLEFGRLLTMVGEDAYRQYAKIMVVVTDGTPDRHVARNSTLRFPSHCSVTRKQKSYIWPLLEADAAREDGIYVMTLALGEQSAVAGDPYQDVNDGKHVKPVFLRRLANDAEDAASDAPFPDGEDGRQRCVETYIEQLIRPKGEVQASVNANDLTMMVGRIWRTVRLRHTL